VEDHQDAIMIRESRTGVEGWIGSRSWITQRVFVSREVEMVDTMGKYF